MARVVVAPTARAQLESLIRTHSLPSGTKERFKRSVRSLGDFPELGPELHGLWRGYRFVLGPWRWMLVVYRYDSTQNRVVIVTVQDARSSISPTANRY